MSQATAAAAPAPAPAAPVVPAGPSITVQAATFGQSCGAPAGNHTKLIADECNGKGSCSYLVTTKAGDPSPNCAKDFSVEYRCGSDTPVTRAEHPAAEGENYKVELNCK